MIGKNFIFDGVEIPYTTAEGMAEGWYADVDWTEVRVRNSILPRQDFHGSISFPTFAEGRLINVSGEIFNASKSVRGSIRNIVQSLFQIVDFPNAQNEIKVLEFTDDDGTEWFIRCKVYTMPNFNHSRAYPIINFSLQLYAQDPLIRSKNKKTGTGNYGVYGGETLPLVLPVELSGSYNHFTVANAGNFASPVKATVYVPATITSLQNIDVFQENQNTSSPIGNIATNTSRAYKFTPTKDTLAGVSVLIKKTGSPTDYFVIEVQTDDGVGKPSGTVIATQVLAGTDLTTSFVEELFIDTEALVIGNDYHVVVRRNGALDAVNYYDIKHSDSDDASGNGNKDEGAGWVAWNRQLYVKTHFANSILNPKIWNLTTGYYFKILREILVGETLVIDTELVTAELDGLNVLAERASGSNWLFASSGNNVFLLTGDNYDVNNQGKATLDIEFYDVNL